MTKNTNKRSYNRHHKIQVMEAGVNLYLEIYIDVIFIINFLMDILLLFVVKKILKYPSSRIRLICSAAAGAAGACFLAVFPYLYGWIQFLITYVVISFCMVVLAFGKQSGKARLKAILLLYFSVFFLGGVINSLYYNSRLGYYFKELMSGNLFGDRNIVWLLAALLTGVGAIYIFANTIKKLRSGNLEIYPTDLYYEDKQIHIKGFLDTGNNLYDPVYGKPVIITELSVIETLLTDYQKNKLIHMLNIAEGKLSSFDESIYENGQTEEKELNIMMIPFRSVGKKNGLLPAFILERVVIWTGDEKTESDRVFTAISRGILCGHREYQAILHKDIL
jgi:stage II sporulation protein GA (sporulation sigma-E factor processing peptidase)